MKRKFLPAEWYPQSGIQLTWPHAGTDWESNLEEVTACFVSIAREIAKREKLLIVCSNKEAVKNSLGNISFENIIFNEISSNDTWARDHAYISVFQDSEIVLNDFVFNGWGLKFPSNLDNQINRKLKETGSFSRRIKFQHCEPFVLEGGSIESDGKGTVLTTTTCLLSRNRNEYLSKKEIENKLLHHLGAERVLWLKHGYLAGDDTDSHIDTLARFCNEDTIAYVQCTDVSDEHYSELQHMEQELQAFKTAEGKPYNLIPLPMADPVFYEGTRLPATYANFLIMNGAVLLPIYNSAKDAAAKSVLQLVFPDREIIGIDCNALIKQHGSLHCVTMQYPEGVL